MLGFQAELRQRCDQEFFESAQITVDVLLIALKLENWIPNKLSRTMISNISASLNVVNG